MKRLVAILAAGGLCLWFVIASQSPGSAALVPAGLTPMAYLPMVYGSGNVVATVTPGSTASVPPTPTHPPVPPWATPTQAPTVQPVPTTSPGKQVLLNGGFENGTSPWLLMGLSERTTNFRHSGSYSMWLGGYNNASDQVKQWVTGPSCSPNASLSFWYLLMSDASSGHGINDRLSVRVHEASHNDLLVQSDRWWWPQRVGYWISENVSVPNAANKSLVVTFLVETDGAYLSAWFVDDVTLTFDNCS